MANITPPDPRYLGGYDCTPSGQKRIIFEGSTLKVVSGSSTLYGLELGSFGQFGSEFGGSFKKTHYINPSEYYTLYGGNIAQDQGEVGMIVIKVRYDKSIPKEDQYITIEYKGKIIPCGTLLFVTGVTKDDVIWHGWDLEPYNTNYSPTINYSPQLDPNITSPDFSMGGMLIYNPTIGQIEVQILVMN